METFGKEAEEREQGPGLRTIGLLARRLRQPGPYNPYVVRQWSYLQVLFPCSPWGDDEGLHAV